MNEMTKQQATNASEFSDHFTVHPDHWFRYYEVRECPRAIDMDGHCFNCKLPVERIEKAK